LAPAKITMLATPFWNPGVASPSRIRGRVAPTPNMRTPGHRKIVLLMR
jgi:hypothetical protein